MTTILCAKCFKEIAVTFANGYPLPSLFCLECAALEEGK